MKNVEKGAAADLRVTLTHIRQAVDWALSQPFGEATFIAPHRHKRTYVQTTWGNVKGCCCIWGAAYLLANRRRATTGPCDAWAEQSSTHEKLFDWLHEGHRESALGGVMEVLKCE